MIWLLHTAAGGIVAARIPLLQFEIRACLEVGDGSQSGNYFADGVALGI